MSARLFPIDLPSREWVEFEAEGFSRPVSGVIYRTDQAPTCGMPLGGIDTGCLDIEASGAFGFSTIFNSHVPRGGPLGKPFLAINVGEETWLLAAPKHRLLCAHLFPEYWDGARQKLHSSDRIHYWGHYPVVDLEFENGCPVSVGLRAWAPFLPGDIVASNTPGAVFEVRLRNTSDQAQEGTLAFSFPGPSEVEAGSGEFAREKLEGALRGIAVTGVNAAYALGAIGEEKVRFGGELGMNGEAWAKVSDELPVVQGESGASVAVDFSLAAGEERTIRFVLAWYSPQWQSGGTPTSGGNTFTHMYATRYHNAAEVGDYLAREHESLLKRVLAWQGVIYDEEKLPVWLRDSLVNILHLITEDGLWAKAKPPVGDWCRSEDGLFGMSEDPRNCPQIECLPCGFYGNLPLVYFFPEAALSTLRGYKAYQFPDGAATWIFGGISGGTPPCEMAMPTRGYQTALNGPCVMDMIDRYWLRTGDDEFLREFYPFVKKNTVFTMNLRPEYPPGDAVISMPTGNVGFEWFEACEWAGMTAHVGSIHLANLKMAERMAKAVGDKQFVAQCEEWLRLGSESMENKLWAGEYYLNYYEPETGKKSDLVMSNQLDGEWMLRLHGLPHVLPIERMVATLKTVKRTGIAATPYGSVNFTRPDGIPASDGDEPGWSYHAYAFFPPEVLMLGMTYIYQGDVEFGLELCRRCWANIVLRLGLCWDQPNVIRGDTGERVYGGDYYQNMMLWALPAAMEGKGLSAPCEPSGLVERVISAAKG